MVLIEILQYLVKYNETPECLFRTILDSHKRDGNRSELQGIDWDWLELTELDGNRLKTTGNQLRIDRDSTEFDNKWEIDGLELIKNQQGTDRNRPELTINWQNWLDQTLLSKGNKSLSCPKKLQWKRFSNNNQSNKHYVKCCVFIHDVPYCH